MTAQRYALSLGVCYKPSACLTQTPGSYRPYRIEGKTRSLSRLMNHTVDISAIAVFMVQAGLPGLAGIEV
jgi:hypothetical protein